MCSEPPRLRTTGYRTEFFAKVGDNQITFVKDSSSKVIKIIVHGGGLDLVAPRVKDAEESPKIQ